MEFKIKLNIEDGVLLGRILNGSISMAESSGLPIDPHIYDSIDRLRELGQLICNYGVYKEGEQFECIMI